MKLTTRGGTARTEAITFRDHGVSLFPKMNPRHNSIIFQTVMRRPLCPLQRLSVVSAHCDAIENDWIVSRHKDRLNKLLACCRLISVREKAFGQS